jgi:hypothetical protein
MTRAALTVEVDGRSTELRPGEEFTFGRDASCTACLDPHDLGISRMAGSIREEDGVWCVVNLSRKRTLHVVDPLGFALPLPVAAPGWPPARRAVDQHRCTILVAGTTWTHAVVVELNAPPRTSPGHVQVTDPASTVAPAPRLTDGRRQVLVAMARGYLRPHPHYDPQPLTYQQVADLLGLREPQVRKRIESVRHQLVDAGVIGLEEPDARRALCEWMLATRLIGATDLDGIEPLIRAARLARRPAAGEEPGRASPDDARPPAPGEQILALTRAAAVAVRPALERRLAAYHGADWLEAVNVRRAAEGFPAGRGLDDHRFCLAVFAHDPATDGWVPARARSMARRLNGLANRVLHDETVGRAEVAEATGAADAVHRAAEHAGEG